MDEALVLRQADQEADFHAAYQTIKDHAQANNIEIEDKYYVVLIEIYRGYYYRFICSFKETELFTMIFGNYSIAYRNVVSKYYNFHPDQLDHTINSFVQLLVENDYHPTGNVFYSMIIELAEDGLMTAEIFIPIEESNFTNTTGEQMFFRSYFLIESMIMTRVLNDFEQKASEKFVELHHYMKIFI
ncbi:DUF5085 family protein [Pseudogracilibacillus sp. SO30301A]|uniref:DUF5085 family protein n=1 Tax=Pseudogracilibacillus sp. SO30301A TaxID=3098291 RepID=UPI00300DFAB3